MDPVGEEKKTLDAQKGTVEEGEGEIFQPQGISRRLYNLPSHLRKSILKNKLSPEEFLAVYGVAIPGGVHQGRPPRGLHITTPQPFDLSDPKVQCKFYKFYVKDLIRREEAEARAIQEHKFRALKAPKHIREALYEKKRRADSEKRARKAELSDLTRRPPHPPKRF